MPNALIVVDDDKKSHIKLVEEMVSIGLIKMVMVKGVAVYGRPYLTNHAIRTAYQKKKKKTKGVKAFKEYINK